MPFHIPGVPVPKSKYEIGKVSFGGIDNIADNYSDDDDGDGKWMCSSQADDLLKSLEEKKKEEHKKTTDETIDEQAGGSIVKGHTNSYSVQQWLDQIEQNYFDERDDLMRQTFHMAFDDVENPYTFTLHVIHKGFFDLYSKRVPIQFYAMEELDTWISHKRKNNENLPPLHEFHKRQAGEFVCRSGYNYLDKLTKLYELDKGKNSFLVPFIQINNLKSKKLKETVTIIYTLKLQKYFDTKEIALPLIAHDQLQVLETYVGDNKKLQHDYVDLLNDICELGEDEIIDMISEKGLKLKDRSKVQLKTVIKIAEKAVKRYNLNPDSYPHIFRAKNLASLRYLVNQRYREERENPDFCAEKWDNLIETSVRGNEWLEKQLIKIYVNKNDDIAVKIWMDKLHLKVKHLPKDIRREVNYSLRFVFDDDTDDNEDCDDVVLDNDVIPQMENITVQQVQEDWDSDLSERGEQQMSFSLVKGFYDPNQTIVDNFYQLGIPFENIILIDNATQLQHAMKTLFQSGNVIAFDCEWKVTICRAGELDKVSLIQLAVNDWVYILDMFKLYVEHSAEVILKEFFLRFFTTKSLIKIGYGINSDLKILIGMFTYMKDFVLSSHCLVDLCEVSQKIMSHPSVIPYLYTARKSALQDKGLSLLVNRTLGKPLDKSYQVSDWERRPLQKQQLQYAALDSYALLQAYKQLQFVLNREKLKMNLNEPVKLKWLKPKENKSKRKDKFENKISKTEIIPENVPLFKGPPRPSTSLKVVCDTMLHGLGRQLRSCGIDTVILESGDNHSTAINIARRENRAVLTRGNPFLQLRGHLAHGMCMHVPEGTVKEQLKMVFTRYNIALQTRDIFSRCNVCNSSHFSQIKSIDMKMAYDLKFEIGDMEMPAEQLTPSRSIDLSKFTLVKTGTELQLDFLSSAAFEKAKESDTLDWLFEKVEIFYVCEQCGKVYWEGSHHGKVIKNFSELIDKRECDKYFYATPG